MRRGIFAVGVLLHLAAAGAHVAALLPRSDDGHPLRHALFVVVNVGVAIGFARRPRWFPWVFAALTAQQIGSHGAAALDAWTRARRIDVASLLVLGWMPLAFALLVQDARRGRTGDRPPRPRG